MMDTASKGVMQSDMYIYRQRERNRENRTRRNLCVSALRFRRWNTTQLSLSLSRSPVCMYEHTKKKKNYTTEAEQMEIGKACKWRGQVRSAGNPLNINNNINMDIN